MPAPRPRHARSTPAPPKPKNAYSPRHACAMPAPRPRHLPVPPGGLVPGPAGASGRPSTIATTANPSTTGWGDYTCPPAACLVVPVDTRTGAQLGAGRHQECRQREGPSLGDAPHRPRRRGHGRRRRQSVAH
eukprot:gene4313-biopygen14474